MSLMKDKLTQLGIDTFKWVETTKACNLKCVGCRRNFAETLAKALGPKRSKMTGKLEKLIENDLRDIELLLIFIIIYSMRKMLKDYYRGNR